VRGNDRREPSDVPRGVFYGRDRVVLGGGESGGEESNPDVDSDPVPSVRRANGEATDPSTLVTEQVLQFTALRAGV
jgi:hypothetical protein